jgi:short-subunit dehydrogenase
MSKGTILITGASSGLGEEMARQFAALGYDLALCARRTDRLEELKAGIVAGHPDRRVELKALDVNDDDAVFRVFGEFAQDFGTIDRVVINAGLGKGAALGTGRYAANKQTAMTNFVAALAQTEAAMEIFRAQAKNGHRGHLVMVSSVSAMRGQRKAITTYAATKAGVAALAEGLQSENVKGVDVSIIYPGYIRSEMNEKVEQRTKFMVDTETGVKAMVDAIEKRKAKANVPAWPWVPLGMAMKHLPMSVVRKLS